MNTLLKKIIPYCSLFILIILVLLMCAVPPVSRDALTHHLAVPKLYIQNGAIIELPNIICSYYPQLLDLIYCIPMFFNNDILPKYIHFLFGLFSAFLIYIYVKKRISEFYGLLSVLLFLSLPVVLKLSITVYVDLGLIFFSFAALTALFKWRKTDYKIKWIIISAFFCGLALSTKYNGLITLCLLALLVPIIYLNKNRKREKSQLYALLYCFFFIFIALTIFSPWMAKNYFWTQNPVYPLYKNVFTSSSRDNYHNSEESSLNHFHIRKYVYNETFLQTLLVPVKIFFQGKDDIPKYFDGRLNPLLFFLPLIIAFNLVFKSSQNNVFEKKIFFIFSLLYIVLVWLKADMRIRWVGPAIPPLVILSAYGLEDLFLRIKQQKFLIYIATILLIIVFSLNFIYLQKLFQRTDPLPYIFNKQPRVDYIQKFRPEFSTLNYANINLNKESKILAFFLGERRYYSENKIFFNRDFLKQTIKQVKTEKEILIELKNNGFTDLIINYSKFNMWVDSEFTENEKKQLYLFFKEHTIKLFSKDDHGLYHLK
jgi:4-amino-4-deoxy-L-arabinose transferase-like glycosyltransferase